MIWVGGFRKVPLKTRHSHIDVLDEGRSMLHRFQHITKASYDSKNRLTRKKENPVISWVCDVGLADHASYS